MTVRGKYQYQDLIFKDAINHSVLFSDFTAPAALGLSLQWFRMPSPCLRVFTQLVNKTQCFLKSLRFALSKTSQPLIG